MGVEKQKQPETHLAAARAEFKRLKARLWQLDHQESHACVDSELMLLWWPKYPLERFVPNPLYFQASEKYRNALPAGAADRPPRQADGRGRHATGGRRGRGRGDPLYNPYEKTPKPESADVGPSPNGAGNLVP